MVALVDQERSKGRAEQEELFQELVEAKEEMEDLKNHNRRLLAQIAADSTSTSTDRSLEVDDLKEQLGRQEEQIDVFRDLVRKIVVQRNLTKEPETIESYNRDLTKAGFDLEAMFTPHGKK